MSLIILGINKHHNASATLTIDNEIIFHIESERISRNKYDWFPFQAIHKIKEYVDHIDILAISGFNPTIEFDLHRKEDAYSAYVLSLGKSFYQNSIKVFDFGMQHHEAHAFTAFYNSGFDSALCIVKDGAGSQYIFNKDSKYKDINGREVSSAYILSYPLNISLVQKQIMVLPPSKNIKKEWVEDNVFISNSFSEGAAFETTSIMMGFNGTDAGKIMGLSSYGKENNNIPEIYDDGLINQSLFKFLEINTPIGSYLPESKIIDFDFQDDFKIKSDFAYSLQKSVEKNVISNIIDLLELTGEKNLCVSGGLFLNCALNYKLIKSLPKDINIYVEPVSGDAGNSIGIAKAVYYYATNSSTKNVQSSLYLGPEPYYDLNKIKKENKVINVDTKYVAKLIEQKKIVAIFQGKSEAGPRALGNRSILYDPRDPNGKDHINKVKGREWFRPFAGSVLLEYANEWFNMASLKESKFMMFAVDVKEDKKNLIPCITHIDGTCRIQTVSELDNKNYYDLIKDFYDLTGVPILFNTSFNLAGDPLVETIDDAIQTFYKSKIDFLYFADIKVLIEK